MLELKLIKAALLNIEKRSPYRDKAQAIAASIPMESLPLEELEAEPHQKGELQDEAMKAASSRLIAQSAACTR
jgi:hypothetical protein